MNQKKVIKVVYTAPNRAHHYRYAIALKSANNLLAFVSGFPRISPRAAVSELTGKLYRSDILQTLYIISLKLNLPLKISNFLAFMSKVEQDYSCRRFIKDCDIFLFYSGSGLKSARYGRKNGIVTIVEAVNSHVEFQEDLLEEESRQIGIKWNPFPEYEKKRRLKEYAEADYILLPSEFVRMSFIVKGFPASKLLKVPYGFEKSMRKSTWVPNDISSGFFTILYVGSISVRKGIRYLIGAFEKLQHPKKRLIIVGPDAQDGALTGVSIVPEIVFTGVLKDEELEQAYDSADVFCLPSIEEGLALVLGEALSFGLPIVTTSNSGGNDIITDEKEGYIVPIRDVEAIFQKLQLLADHPDVLYELRMNAQLRSRSLNGWEETTGLLINTLREVGNR